METELPVTESVEQKVEALESLISGPLTYSASRLLSRSRGLPSGKDFHFYNNFDEFKLPAREIATKAESSLGEIASSISLWGSKKPPPLPEELDEAYDWLVNLNDDFLEKFGVSMDDFRSSREKQEQNGMGASGDGFQLVCGKKKKKESVLNQERNEDMPSPLGIKMVSRDQKTTAARAKVPFHLPNIPRPQTEFNILVNNKNTPFQHVWLEMSEDESHLMHPLEKLSVVDFVDRNIKEDEIIKPLSLERTPFKLVEGVKELKELACKLRGVDEFAVDLEHNNYRSFLGLTCLMQISTRMEDFIVDTFKLRVHIGPYLREHFKDPLKKKVMHGADRDILWLQRDFGIYVCNLFDTGQASRLLQLERNSLEFLLHHFCDVDANKEYQNADWRIRPLPDEMIKYAREDTHYLLHIYDLMRCKLLSMSSSDNDLLLEVYKRSSDICMQFYEKELLSDTSYLHVYGLSEAGFDSKQLAIVSGLCAWRDQVAREDDESTGYILPNKAVLEIARQMPQTSGSLRRLVKSKHQYVERNLNTVLKIIKNAIANSSAFEDIAVELRKKHLESLAMQPSETVKSELVAPNYLSLYQTSSTGSCQEENKMHQLSLLDARSDIVGTVENEKHNGTTLSFQLHKEAIPTVSVQAMKKPAGGFGALFGNSSRRKAKPLNCNVSEQEKNESKLEQIKASVILPFYSFASQNISRTHPMENAVPPPQTMQGPEQTFKTTMTEDIMPLEIGTSADPQSPPTETLFTGTESLMSLSDLSSGFQLCNGYSGGKKDVDASIRPSQEPQLSPELTPFDYSAARKNFRFGEAGGERGDGSLPASRDAKKGFRSSRKDDVEERERGQQPRRRQAFPPSGNRSATYRC